MRNCWLLRINGNIMAQWINNHQKSEQQIYKTDVLIPLLKFEAIHLGLTTGYKASWQNFQSSLVIDQSI